MTSQRQEWKPRDIICRHRADRADEPWPARYSGRIQQKDLYDYEMEQWLVDDVVVEDNEDAYDDALAEYDDMSDGYFDDDFDADY